MNTHLLNSLPEKRALFILPLLLAYLLLSAVYNITVPLGEGPDEPGHLRYILFLAREHRLPVQREQDHTSDVPGEGHQPPLAYLLMLPAVSWLPDEAQHIMQTSNPNFLWNGGTEPAAFMRSSREYQPWQGMTLAWHLARGVSSLLGAITVFCTWGIARSLAPAGKATTIGLLAAALVAFNPQFLFTSALVTNDMLLITLSSIILWLCITPNRSPQSGSIDDGPETVDEHRTPAAGIDAAGKSNTTQKHPPLSTRSPHRQSILLPTLLLGILFGLALLTKQNAFLLAPLLLWRSWHDGNGNLRKTIELTALWGSIALLIAGWWYLRNWQLYGDPLGLTLFHGTFATQPFDWTQPVAWFNGLRQLHASFWATFGWLSLPAPAAVHWCYTLLEILAIAGLLRRRLSHPTSSNQSKKNTECSLPDNAPCSMLHAPLLLLLLFAFAWTVSFALTAGVVAWQGRMLFPALPAIAVLLAGGLHVWLPNRKGAVLLPIAPLFALALWLAPGVIAPAYTWNTLPPATARQRITFPTYARYAKEWERGAELHGVQLYAQDGTRVQQPRVQAGQTITATFTWHALEYLPRDWTVFVHLVDSDGTIVSEHNSQPQMGRFPMTRWTPGDWLEDAHPLVLPETLPAGTYTLRVGFYKPWNRDPQRGSRQRVWNKAGEEMGDYAQVIEVRVE
jgi:hypothetical protein